MLQVFTTSLAVAGTAVTLVFPGMVLARHRRAGTMRFLGLPGWAIGFAIAGLVVLGAAVLALAIASTLPDETRFMVLLVARPAQTGGLALATAGVLCAEILRRSVPVRAVKHVPRHSTGRIEVTYPPEHRTYAFPSVVPHAQGRSG
jgi:hypothetical protein